MNERELLNKIIEDKKEATPKEFIDTLEKVIPQCLLKSLEEVESAYQTLREYVFDTIEMLHRTACMVENSTNVTKKSSKGRKSIAKINQKC